MTNDPHADLIFNVSDSRLGNVSIELNRTNVFVGMNGCGKSTLLQSIHSCIAAQFDCVRVKGGRAAVGFDQVQQVGYPAGMVQNVSQGVLVGCQTLAQHASSDVSSRVSFALRLLSDLEQSRRIVHSKKVQVWQESQTQENQTSPPPLPELPIARVFESFAEVFPGMSITYTENTNQLLVVKNGSQPYPLTGLSDGEKQVFNLLVDIVAIEERRQENGESKEVVYLVDEPEQNLNPFLAQRFWSVIEETFSEYRFVYATHCVAIASRASVDKLYAVGSNQVRLVAAPHVGNLTKEDIEQLLGVLPGLLNFKSALVVEGSEISTDVKFYRWLTSNSRLNVVPANGGCNDVLAIVRRSNVWQCLSPDIQIFGVVDGDYSEPGDSKSSWLALEVMEVESFLLDPELLLQVATHLALINPLPTHASLVASLVELARKHKYYLCCQRIFRRLRINLSVSLEDAVVKGITTDDLLIKEIGNAAKDECEKTSLFAVDKVKQLVESELAAFENALSTQDVSFLLKYLGRKFGIVTEMAKKVGAKDERSLLNCVVEKFEPTNCSRIKELYKKLPEWLFSDAQSNVA